jgi:hypothetical protein
MKWLTIQLIIEMMRAPIIAEVKDATVNPDMICATNQKNNPLMTREKRPKVIILSGSVSRLTIGFTTILRNTRHTPTITAVRIPLTVIPDTK